MRLDSGKPSPKQFFAVARERYRMMLAKEGKDEFFTKTNYNGPWTDDPVLKAFRFCNVFREDDKTTRWFKENIREPLNTRENPVKLILATIAFRWFNRIETGELIKQSLLLDGWNPTVIRATLQDVSPIVTGAYMIKTPAKMSKLEGIIQCMNKAASMTEITNLGDMSLQAGHTYLTRVPYIGGFMAYEVISDLRHTCLFEQATDIMDWCHLGPGAARGIKWVTGQEYNRNSPLDQESMLHACRQLLELSKEKQFWPSEWPKWEMREVEHWLCEYDKWCRGTYNGQSLKRRYPNGNHTSK